MKYLLDTHTVLWFITDDPSLPRTVREEIKNINNTCLVSIASLWEMGIKHSLGKLHLKNNLSNLFSVIESYPFEILPLLTVHILQLSSLQMQHHRDPFDRLLIAQAQTEGLITLTKDKAFSGFDVSIKWN